MRLSLVCGVFHSCLCWILCELVMSFSIGMVLQMTPTLICVGFFLDHPSWDWKDIDLCRYAALIVRVLHAGHGDKKVILMGMLPFLCDCWL